MFVAGHRTRDLARLTFVSSDRTLLRSRSEALTSADNPLSLARLGSCPSGAALNRGAGWLRVALVGLSNLLIGQCGPGRS